MTAEGARQAVDAGVDGLVHVFMDRSPEPPLIDAITRSGAFVVSTISTLVILG